MEKFSFKRFWNVFHCEYAKMRVFYVSILAMTIAIVFICGSVMMFPYAFGHTFRSVIAFFFESSINLMYVGVICTSAMFAFSGLNKTMIPDLMLPASNAEKFWAKYAVYWLIPALFAFSLIWLMPYFIHYGDYLRVMNGQREMYPGGGFDAELLAEIDQIRPTRWQAFRSQFCIYLCLSGIMLLVSAIYFKNASPQKFGTVVGIVTFVLITIALFSKTMEVPDFLQDFAFYITAESYRVTIFQLTLGLSIVAICTAIAYRRFCRLTLK